MASDKPKLKHICRLPCPNCGQEFDVLKEVKVIEPAVAAVKEERYVAAKVTQTKLEDH